ncbi:response regulator FixJ [Dongia sp.]|uniref:response regulator FixJ n=1 Tax=Dongia sp. TaxID=1977262 RepID=UPI0037533F59
MVANAVVHVIDDDESVRHALAFLLATSGIPVRVHESGDAFLETVDGLQPGCILTDIRMPGIDGLALQRRLAELGINLPVIVMTGHGDVPMAVEAMKWGAVDFIEKPFDDAVLLKAIQTALDRYSEQGQREYEAAQITAKVNGLSIRERQVLDGLIAGRANKTIAHDLEISPRTVEIHRANVMTKMGAGSLSELVRMALLAGLIPPK